MDASGYTPQEKMSFEEKGKEMGIEIMNLMKFNDHLAKATFQRGSDKKFKVFPCSREDDWIPRHPKKTNWIMTRREIS